MSHEVRKMIRAALRPLTNRVRMTVTRGLLNLIDDSKGIQVVQLSRFKDEVLAGVEHMQPYGFSSHPPKGAQALILEVAPDHAVAVIISDRETRLKSLPEGDSAIYRSTGERM